MRGAVIRVGGGNHKHSTSEASTGEHIITVIKIVSGNNT